jgi:hypothetical protein
MSAGNACAAIGLANTNKVPAIGAYVQDITPVGPGADGPYIGTLGMGSTDATSGYWTTNWLQEDKGFTAPATSGTATGKLGHWVTTDAAAMTVAADGLCDVTSGVVTALATTGTYKTYLPAAAVVPAGAWLWVFAV